jgi:hypothetical protein
VYPAGKAGTSYAVPAGVTSIGQNAFAGCSSLTTINLPAGLTSIGQYAFRDCSSLTTINLPAGLTSIGSYAFNRCNNLGSITVASANPPTLSGSLWSGTLATLIYVPSASLDQYKNANGWKNHADKIQAATSTGTLPNTGSVLFDGWWELPNGQLQLIKGNTFILYTTDTKVVNLGIFTNTSDQFFLQVVDAGTAVFGYTADNKNIRVTGTDNEWIHGTWKKRDDIVFTGRGINNPLVGYWKNTNGEDIIILHIMPNGWGDRYTCDKDYQLKSHQDIEYSDEETSQFTMITRGEGFTISLPLNYVLDGQDLLVGFGEDVSTYSRYTKE